MEKSKIKQRSSLTITSSNKSIADTKNTASQVIHFGCQLHSGTELWNTSYFLSILFELLDEYKDKTNEESRLTAFILCRLDEIHFNRRIPIKLIIEILKHFTNIRMKILLLLELLSISEPIDCPRALMLLWQFSAYGYLTLFYVLDRLKFSITDKDLEWKSLLTIFEPLENKKHAAYILLDKTNFYKPNQATIVFGSKKLTRYF
ncbi:unnamed protein product [Adineta ricciae]|uniref:Uncharacterized protein n=1 Tax=Adineta ricciae TaxID=249248 RepID=A0A814QPM2_ADIRI|nr:unnamed protein product [Adineta ricciae]